MLTELPVGNRKVGICLLCVFESTRMVFGALGVAGNEVVDGKRSGTKRITGYQAGRWY